MTERRGLNTSALSAAQIAYLIEAKAFTEEELVDTQARVARGELAAEEAATRRQAIDESLDAREAATALGIDAREVNLWRAKGALFAFAADGEYRYPTWQFTADPQRPLLPGLEKLIPSIPHDWPPAGMRSFMATPQRSARIDGVPVTPVEWLLRGGDPRKLSGILESFLQS